MLLTFHQPVAGERSAYTFFLNQTAPKEYASMFYLLLRSYTPTQRGDYVICTRFIGWSSRRFVDPLWDGKSLLESDFWQWRAHRGYGSLNAYLRDVVIALPRTLPGHRIRTTSSGCLQRWPLDARIR